MSARVLMALLAFASEACSPARPTATWIMSVRYVRTLPLIGPNLSTLRLNYGIPVPDATPPRLRSGVHTLNSVDGITYEIGLTFQVPADIDCVFSVDDPSVSDLPVARDIYVNGTRLRRIQTQGRAESAWVRIDRAGSVYEP